MSVQTGNIMNAKKTSPGKRMDVSLDTLYFDPANPRLPRGKRTVYDQLAQQCRLRSGS